MSRPFLSVHMPLHRAVEFDYPAREAIASVAPIADEIVLVAQDSGDGTWELAGQIAQDHPGKVEIFRRDWWDEGRGCYALSDATNFAIEQCRGEWHLALQADEVVHESQLETLLALCRQDTHPWVLLERLNFYGRFDRVNRNRERWPCDVVRLARRDLYPHICSHGDATHLGIPQGYDPHRTPRLDARAHVALWHYCYVRPGRAFVDRQANMAKLYGWEPDPQIEACRETQRVDWKTLVPDESEFAPIPMEHPAVMQEWIAARRERVEAGAWE